MNESDYIDQINFLNIPSIGYLDLVRENEKCDFCVIDCGYADRHNDNIDDINVALAKFKIDASPLFISTYGSITNLTTDQELLLSCNEVSTFLKNNYTNTKNYIVFKTNSTCKVMSVVAILMGFGHCAFFDFNHIDFAKMITTNNNKKILLLKFDCESG